VELHTASQIESKSTAQPDNGVRWSSHLLLNDYLPKIEVDAQTYEVRADGQLLTCEPAQSLPLRNRLLATLGSGVEVRARSRSRHRAPGRRPQAFAADAVGRPSRAERPS
jgi:hypothetical protein